jgi:tRNA-2-methylthio-N6-dimethylallyladenosine synthase
MRIVNFKGNPRLIGQMIDVTITQVNPNSLRGDVLTHESVTA